MRKKILVTTVTLGLLVLFVSSVEASIQILRAKIAHGEIEVAGFHAPRMQAISWQGVSLGIKSNRFGVFAFATTVLPEDCVGRLKIGHEERDVVIKDCTATSEATAAVVKTGQTACYGILEAVTCAGTGQDGEFQKGTARSYTTNADGTITDKSTGLVWEKLTGDEKIHDVRNLYTWSEAFAKIAALNKTPCFAGHCDWRLPNINELRTLVDYGRVNPAIDPEFNNPPMDSFTQSSIYWSSTTAQGAPGEAWFVLFIEGHVSPDDKSFSYYVRAVRGGS